MTTVTVLPPGTVAQTGTFDSAAYASVTVWATNLAGAEVVAVNLMGGNAVVPVSKADGTPLTLTLATPSALLPGGPNYQFVEGVTVGQSGVFAAPRLVS